MKTFTITALLALFCSFPPAQAQQTGEIGGEALQLLSRTDNGKYDRYVTEYKRMYAMYTGDGTFADYLTDGKKYTVIVPDNTGIEVYYRTEGAANGNPPRLRNTLKYNIIKGKLAPGAFNCLISTLVMAPVKVFFFWIPLAVITTSSILRLSSTIFTFRLFRSLIDNTGISTV